MVRWGGSDRTTTYVSATQLTASITASDIATAGAASVTVFNPTLGGGISNMVSFRINAPREVFRNGQWLLNLNGNGAWDGCGIDGCFGSFGMAGDKPVIGAW